MFLHYNAILKAGNMIYALFCINVDFYFTFHHL